jgi:hypothetical protein
MGSPKRWVPSANYTVPHATGHLDDDEQPDDKSGELPKRRYYLYRTLYARKKNNIHRCDSFKFQYKMSP